MYQLNFADTPRWRAAPIARPAGPAGPPLPPVERLLLLNWEEHCQECAIPDCFATCSLYRRRRDGRCARFAWGIQPNPAFRGTLPFGADVGFRRWAKLEAHLDDAGWPIRPAAHRLFQRVAAVTGRAYRLFAFVNRRPALRRRLRSGNGYDEFILEYHTPGGGGDRLVLEYFILRDGRREMVFRHGFPIVAGPNHHRLPVGVFGFERTDYSGYLHLYPEDVVEEHRLIFTRLDFVRYRGAPASRPRPPQTVERAPLAGSLETPRPATPPAVKVKCVAWDLDGTLWDGILVESDPDRLVCRPGVAELIRTLDERGILQSVVSKNDHARAWPVVERLGLAPYFLYPEINWGPKSVSLKRIAAALDIGLDSLALIDDSAFERAEVAYALSGVRVYPESEIGRLAGRPEFDVPATDVSRRRRLLYRDEAARQSAAVGFSDDYLGFLKHCDLRLRIFWPRSESDVARCLELIQRSNQLNLSARRYDATEFAAVLADPAIDSYAFACRDRFGDYGLVGFASVDRSAERPCLRDLVISCRVARKRVDSALLAWLAERTRGGGADALDLSFVHTGRNDPMFETVADLPFVRIASDGPVETLRWRLDAPVVRDEPVTVETDL